MRQIEAVTYDPKESTGLEAEQAKDVITIRNTKETNGKQNRRGRRKNTLGFEHGICRACNDGKGYQVAIPVD